MVASARRDDVTAPAGSEGLSYVVDVPGGRLTVTERADGHLELTGPAELVAHGTLDEIWSAGE